MQSAKNLVEESHTFSRPSMLLPPSSFIIPCLNEADSIRDVLVTIENIRDSFEALEVILVDNGSEDGSIDRALEFDVKVVHCGRRGYGSTLRAGIANATHDNVVFADADNTYDWCDAVPLVATLVGHQFDLVVGNRLGSGLEKCAMPFLNRHLGTPALSYLITLLFGQGKGTIVRDCNGGMRAFKRSAFESWATQSNGMEFASEMIARALLAGARYSERPVKYRKSPPNRKSHLRPFRDGARHLRELLSIYFEHK